MVSTDREHRGRARHRAFDRRAPVRRALDPGLERPARGRHERDRAVEVGSEGTGSRTGEGGERVGRGMAIVVARADRYERPLGSYEGGQAMILIP